MITSGVNKKAFARSYRITLSTTLITVNGIPKIKITGKIKPRKKKVRVYIYNKVMSGANSYSKIATKKTNSKGRFTYHTSVPYDTAYYKVRAKVKGRTISKTKQYTPPFKQSCGTRTAFFTAYPVGLGNIDSILPLGNLNPSSHTFPTDHIYLYLKKSNPADPNSAPLQTPYYAPGSVWITDITVSRHATDGYTDYSITFYACKQLVNQYGHITSLSSKIASYLKPPYTNFSDYVTGGKRYINYAKRTAIKVSAGEKLGTTGGRVGQNALDFNTYDLRHTLSFAKPSRWTQSQVKNAACPLDYYSLAPKATLQAKLGYGVEHRSVAPICGQVNQDVVNTAQGVWFKSGVANTYPEDPHMALVHDNVNPAIAVFSVGTSLSSKGLASGRYFYTPSNSGYVNRDFHHIVPGASYCFEPTSREGSPIASTIILLQMTNTTTLKIEKQTADDCGSRPWSFGSNYVTFVR